MTRGIGVQGFVQVRLAPFQHQVRHQSADQAQAEQDREEQERLFREQRQHDKGFIAAGRDHGGDQGPKRDHAVHIEAHHGIRAQAARRHAQKSRKGALDASLFANGPLPAPL